MLFAGERTIILLGILIIFMGFKYFPFIWQEDPKNRPTSVQVLEHPAVSKYSKNKMNMDSLIKQICPVSSY